MYDVSGDGVEFEVRNGEPKTIRFKSPFPSGDPAVDEARAYLYEAEGADEGVVFVHGMGRRSLFWPHYYPRMFSRCGFTPVMPVLPFHYDSVSSERDHYDRFIGGPTEVMEEKFRHAVADVCTCVEFLKRSGCRRVQIMGISMNVPALLHLWKASRGYRVSFVTTRPCSQNS